MDDIILGLHVPLVEDEPLADSVRRRVRAGPQQHVFLQFVIGDPAKRDWHIPAGFAPEVAPPGPLCVGCAAVSWEIFELTPNLQAEWGGLHRLERHGFSQSAFGYLRYSIVEMFLLDLGEEMPEWVEGAEQDPETAYRLFEAYAESLVEGSGLTMQATLAKYPHLTMRVARLPWGSLDYARSLDMPASFILTRLGARNDRLNCWGAKHTDPKRLAAESSSCSSAGRSSCSSASSQTLLRGHCFGGAGQVGAFDCGSGW